MHRTEILVALAMPMLLVGMLAAHRLGRRLGKAHWARNPERADQGSGAVDGALFALLGLLVTFTFYGAGERLQERRMLIVEEANTITTAYLRIDLLPAAAQPQLRADFRRYVEARIALYRSLPEPELALRYKRESETLQQAIWRRALAAAAQLPQTPPTLLVVPALNAMIDITATRAMSLRMHPPLAIFLLLGLLALLCALDAGFGSAPLVRPSRFHVYGFAVIIVLTVYLTVDMEFPRHGLIRVDSADQLLMDARASMR